MHRSLNERGLFDYLLLNDDLDNTATELFRIAERAYQGLPAEPGQVPDEVRFEEDTDEAAASNVEQQLLGSPNSNAAAAAAAGMQAAAALPAVRSDSLSASSRQQPAVPPEAEAATASPATAGGLVKQQSPEIAEQQAEPQQQQQQAQPHQVPEQQLQLQQLPPQPAGPSGAAAGAAVAAGLDAWRGKVALVSTCRCCMQGFVAVQQEHLLQPSMFTESSAEATILLTQPASPSHHKYIAETPVTCNPCAQVTGASSGIGWAVCEALGRAGLRVVAVARRRERLQELQQVVLGPSVGMAPTDFLPVVCDVTKEAEVSWLTSSSLASRTKPVAVLLLAGVVVYCSCSLLSSGSDHAAAEQLQAMPVLINLVST